MCGAPNPACPNFKRLPQEKPIPWYPSGHDHSEIVCTRESGLLFTYKFRGTIGSCGVRQKKHTYATSRAWTHLRSSNCKSSPTLLLVVLSSSETRGIGHAFKRNLQKICNPLHVLYLARLFATTCCASHLVLRGQLDTTTRNPCYRLLRLHASKIVNSSVRVPSSHFVVLKLT